MTAREIRKFLRGMHYQAAPAEETKLVRCTRGAVYDVLVDLRPGLATYGRWVAVELTAANRHALYIPGGVAHGFQTLCDDTELFYEISTRYQADLQRGVRWDDQAIGIEWPDCPERIIAERDRSFAEWQYAPDFLCKRGSPHGHPEIDLPRLTGSSR